MAITLTLQCKIKSSNKFFFGRIETLLQEIRTLCFHLVQLAQKDIVGQMCSTQEGKPLKSQSYLNPPKNEHFYRSLDCNVNNKDNLDVCHWLKNKSLVTVKFLLKVLLNCEHKKSKNDLWNLNRTNL